MEINFTKYHGNGNDFIIVGKDESERIRDMSGFSKKYCDRRFGIGGDGVIFVKDPNNSDKADIRMSLFQPDGSKAEMCGNGVRCLVEYAKERGYIGEKGVVETPSGKKEFRCENGLVSVEMGVPEFESSEIPAKQSVYETEIEGWEVTACNTGVPHAVVFISTVEELEDVDIREEAPPIRHNDEFPEGANVNFAAKIEDNRYRVRTFERGVEDETYSCGTGSVAVAAVVRELDMSESDEIDIVTRGGELTVIFEDDEEGNGGVFMRGPAEKVFSGTVDH